MDRCIHLHSKIFIALEASLIPDPESLQIDCAQTFTEIEELRPKNTETCSEMSLSTLGGIYVFDDLVKNLELRNKDVKLIFIVQEDSKLLIRSSFLFGCHMVMSRGLGFEETYLSFKPWHHIFQQFYTDHGISVEHYLRSFCCAKVLDWIDFRFTPSTRSVSQVMIDKVIHDER